MTSDYTVPGIWEEERSFYTAETLIEAIKKRAPIATREPTFSIGNGNEALVYFLTCRDRLKVGMSNNPGFRLRQIQGHCPYQVVVLGVLLGGAVAEDMIKKALRHVWVHGEWFHLNDQLEHILCLHTFHYSGLRSHRPTHAPMPPGPTQTPNSKKRQKLTRPQDAEI